MAEMQILIHRKNKKKKKKKKKNCLCFPEKKILIFK